MDNSLMQFLLGLGVLVVLGYGGFHIIRQRIKARHDAEYDIPDFLSHDPTAKSNPSTLNSDWVEVYPPSRRGVTQPEKHARALFK